MRNTKTRDSKMKRWMQVKSAKQPWSVSHLRLSTVPAFYVVQAMAASLKTAFVFILILRCIDITINSFPFYSCLSVEIIRSPFPVFTPIVGLLRALNVHNATAISQVTQPWVSQVSSWAVVTFVFPQRYRLSARNLAEVHSTATWLGVLSPNWMDGSKILCFDLAQIHWFVIELSVWKSHVLRLHLRVCFLYHPPTKLYRWFRTLTKHPLSLLPGSPQR